MRVTGRRSASREPESVDGHEDPGVLEGAFAVCRAQFDAIETPPKRQGDTGRRVPDLDLVYESVAFLDLDRDRAGPGLRDPA